MNLTQLEYFINLADTLNFTKAASKCFISQTAMTQQIRALEKNIGVELFIRDKHHVELTPAGKIYLNEARQIVKRSKSAIALARMASEGMSGNLTIGYIRGSSRSDLTEHVRSFHKAYPNIKIKFVRNNMSILLEKLNSGECDLAIAVVPINKEIKGIDHRYLESYPVMAVLPEEHPLAGNMFITYEDLRNEEFIMMQPENRPKDQMEESMLIHSRCGYIPNVVAVEGDPESLMLMISIGMGISILPEYITSTYSSHKGIKILPLMKADGTAEVIELEAWWKKDNQNPAIEHMLTFLSRPV